MPPRSIRAKSARGRDERAIAMNLDTREKRASGVHVGLAWRGLLPLPDGTLDQADRQQTAAFYAGIAAGGGAAAHRRLPPLPEGPLARAERQQPAAFYAGIAAAAVPAITGRLTRPASLTAAAAIP